MLNRREMIKSVAAMSTVLVLPKLSFASTPVRNLYTQVVLVADIPNKNNRIYPKKLLERVVAEMQEVVRNRGLLGQMGFHCMVADIELLDTPCGAILKSMIKEGYKFALRTFGVGHNNFDGDSFSFIIQDSYKLISISVIDESDAA